MSSTSQATLAALRARTLELYGAVTVLMLLGIAALVGYAIALGPLTSPGTERSFGFAVALMALMGAVIFHLADRTYRAWPFGRRFRPSPPGPVTTSSWVRLLKVLVVVFAFAAIAYLVWSLVA